jgi:type IV pilus assembly protein PilC
MPNFKCKLVSNKTGVSFVKVVQAINADSLEGKVGQAYTLVSFKEVKVKHYVALKSVDLIFFFSYLCELTRIGVSLQESLHMIANEIKVKSIKEFTHKVLENLNAGNSLAASFSLSTKSINDFFLSIIKMGEQSNNMLESFEYIIRYIKVSKMIRSKTRKAMIYPSFLLVLMTSLIIAASVFIIPKMTDFAASMGVEMPSYTLALKVFADVIREYWIFFIPTVVASVISLPLIAKFVPGIRMRLDKIKIKTPFVGAIVVKSDMAKFCLFFAMAYRSGVDVIESLRLSKTVVSNYVIKQTLDQMAISVSSGVQMSIAMEGTVIPDFTARMFKIGENTGDLAASLENVVSFYTKEIDTLIDSLVSSIKPIGILGAGGLLIWIISSTLLPIYTQFLQKIIT